MKLLNKPNWRLSEVKSFLEDLIHYDEATTDEQYLYEEYHYNGKMDTSSPTFKILLHKMNKQYGGEI